LLHEASPQACLHPPLLQVIEQTDPAAQSWVQLPPLQVIEQVDPVLQV